VSNQAYTLGLAAVGQDVVVWPMAKITSPESIYIGHSVIIDDFVFLMGGKRTSVGSFVHIASFTSITGGGELIMEDFTTLSSGVRVFTGNEDYSGACMTGSGVPSPYRRPIRSFVQIRRHAIVGAEAIIFPGVTIGEGAVIGANSLVRKNCEPWTVYVGSPAKPIKTRPRERILAIEAQLRSEFYDDNGCYIPKRLRTAQDSR
jgi:acetyltransferase-like isoleucine patch superfamily enzyme